MQFRQSAQDERRDVLVVTVRGGAVLVLGTAVANPAAQIDFSSGVTPLKGLNYE